MLGWIYAAGLRQYGPYQRSAERRTSKFDRLTEALTTKLEQQLNARQTSTGRSTEQMAPYSMNGRAANTGIQILDTSSVPRPNLESDTVLRNGKMNGQIERKNLSKEEALERMLELYRSNPGASYEEIGRAIGRSKGTVANYVKELKEQQRIAATDDSTEEGSIIEEESAAD